MRIHSFTDTQPVAPPPGLATKRSLARQVQHMLHCNLGRVLDLSSGGMKIMCSRVPAGAVAVSFPDYPLPQTLKGRAVWSRPMGNFHYEVGVRFEKPSRDMCRRLYSLATNNRFRRAV